MRSLLLDRVEALRKELRVLPHEHSIVFAALCTERLYPFFEEFSRCAGIDDVRLFRRLLDPVWDYVAAGSSKGVDFSELKELCYGIELANEDGDSRYPGCDPSRGALDAVRALYKTIELCEGADSDAAAYVAEIAMERICDVIERDMDIPGVPTAQEWETDQEWTRKWEEAEAARFRSPEMQREIGIQDRQLGRLKSARMISKQLIAELRKPTDTH